MLEKQPDSVMVRRLQLFVDVAEHGSISEVARNRGVTQSAVTQSILALERTLSTSLFLRGGTTLILTRSGDDLLSTARYFVKQFIDSYAEILRFTGRASRKLVVGVGSPRLMFSTMRTFAQSCPDIEMSYVYGNGEILMAGTRSMEVDIAQISHIGAPPAFFSKMIFRNRLSLAVSNDHDLARREAVSVADLRDVRIILREMGSVTRQVFEASAEAQQVDLADVLTVPTREATHQAALAGLGVAPVLEFEQLQEPGLTFVPILNGHIGCEEYLICNPALATLPTVRRFFEFFLENTNPALNP